MHLDVLRNLSRGRLTLIGARRISRVSLGFGVAAAISLCLASAVPSAATGRSPSSVPVGSVGLDFPLFWNGVLVVGKTTGANLPYGFSEAGDAPVETCGAVGNPDPCWAYSFDVTEPADRLRVAIDLSSRGECYAFELYAPGTYGDTSKPRMPVGGPTCPELFPIFFPQVWNWELAVDRPALGTWTVRIVPYLVEKAGFRFRATLENKSTSRMEVVLPNLRPYPPYEFGFVAPANPAAGSAVDKQNPPGAPGISCTADELAEAAELGEHPLRRLRFSTGAYNIGAGPLDLLLLPDTQTGGSVMQRIHRSDGTVAYGVPAGEWTFHAAHNHSHYLGYVDFELYRVITSPPGGADPNGKRLELVSRGRKAGWHPFEQRMADWQRFNQAPAGALFFACDAAGENCITQMNGWGDHYRWQRPDNYVDFPINPDMTNVNGDYVVRVIVNNKGLLTENSTADNMAYAWIRVRRDQVTICQRGYGASPWDPPLGKTFEPSFWLATSVGTSVDSATAQCP